MAQPVDNEHDQDESLSILHGFGTSIVTGTPSTFLGAFLEDRQLKVGRRFGCLPRCLTSMHWRRRRFALVRLDRVGREAFLGRFPTHCNVEATMSRHRRGTVVSSWPRRGFCVLPGALAAEVHGVQESECESEGHGLPQVSQYISHLRKRDGCCCGCFLVVGQWRNGG